MPSVSVRGRESCLGGGCWSVTSQSEYPLRKWVTDPTRAVASAESRGIPVVSLFCSGCQRLLIRLQSEGKWPV